MSEQYTPTTEQVRATYLGGTLIEFREEGFGRFQRWLAEVERAAAEKAYEQGRLDERHDCNRYAEYEEGKLTADQLKNDLRPRNPYRQERKEQ